MKKFFALITFSIFAVILFSCGGGNSSSNESKKMTVNLENGKVVYDKICIACHMVGVAGAASLTDKPRWDEMAAKGIETLHKSVVNGILEGGKYGVMPEKGQCTDCSDQDLYDAVGYMLKEAGVTAK